MFGYVAYSASNRLLLAGISDPNKTGAIWCYRYPLTD